MHSRSCHSKCTWARAELGSECPIEVGDITEATVQRDVQHLALFAHQSCSGLAQAGTSNVLMWGEAGHTLEETQEVIRAQVGLSRQGAQGEGFVGMTIDRSHGAADTCFGIRRCGVQPGCDAGCQCEADGCQAHCQLFPRYVRCTKNTVSGARHEWRERPQRWYPGDGEDRTGSACAGIGRQPLEVVGCVPEREAPITLAVLMPALEAVPFAAEHQRPRCHQFASEGRTVLEGAGENYRNRVALVPFFERAIARAGRADDICNGPAVATREDARCRAPGRPVLPAARKCALEVDRNFRQDPISRCAL